MLNAGTKVPAFFHEKAKTDIHKKKNLCGKNNSKKSKKIEKNSKKGVDISKLSWYYNQALKRAATSEAKQGP